MNKFSKWDACLNKEEGQYFVRQDGSGGVFGNRERFFSMHDCFKALVPEKVRWSDWPHDRYMIVTKENVQNVRKEIALRWTDMMNSYVNNDI